MTKRYDTEYRVGANTSPAEQALKGLLKQSKRVGSGIAGNFSSSGLALGKMAGAAGGVVAAIGAIAVAGKQAAEEVSKMSHWAKTAGVDFGKFQELKFVGDQVGIEMDDVADGLKEMQLRADEFIETGAGPAAEAFARLGMNAKELKASLKEPDVMFEQLMDRIKAFDTAGQLRLTDELFGGTAGERFMRLLDDSGKSIAEVRQEARDLGIVMDDDMRATAAKINKEWDKMSTIISVNVKSALLEVVNLAFNFHSQIQSLENSSTGKLRSRLQFLKEEYQKFGDLGGMATGGAYDGAAANDEIKKITELLNFRRRASNIKTNVRISKEVFAPSGESDLQRREREKREEAARRLAARASALASSAAKRQSDRITGVTSSLQFELEQIKRTAAEQEIHNQLRSASVDISSKAGIEISNLVRELGKEKSAREGQVAIQELVNQRLVEAQQSQSYLVDTSLSGLESMILGTESVEDALKRMIVQMGIAAAKAALLGEGPLAGLFGGSTNLFSSGLQSTIGADLAVAAGTGGLFAQGGVSNRPAIFGEAGPEAAVPLPNGRDIPVDLRLPTRLANDNAPSITYSPTIDARGADEAAIARLERVMADDRRQFEDRVRGVVQDSRSRAVGL